MTSVLLTVSVACNLWFLFLLLYDRIVETKLVRFFKGIHEVWQSLHSEKEVVETETEQPAVAMDIVGKSRFKMPPTRTNTTIAAQEAATSGKGIEVSEDDITFDDEKAGMASDEQRPVQIPADKLDETFTSIPSPEMEYGEDEQEDYEPDRRKASGYSFDEINEAVNTAKNPKATTVEKEHAAKVFSDMEGTELYDKLMENSSEISIHIKGLIEIRLKSPKKEFVIPEKLEDFNIRDFV